MLKSKIPMLRGGGFAEFDPKFKFAKIQNSYVVGGFMEFDAEFRFAKIQNSYVEGGVGGIRFGLGKESEKVEIFLGWGGGLAESNLDLGRKMTKLKFSGWGGLAESDLDLGRKMTKLKFSGWGGGLAESNLDLGRKMAKVEILGGGGLVVKRILVVC